jgi:hypothetical protein
MKFARSFMEFVKKLVRSLLEANKYFIRSSREVCKDISERLLCSL